MNLVNPSRSTYYSDTINSLSDTSRFISCGSAKGSILDNPTWVGDFSFKSPTNFVINPHIGYISFFSDREIFYQEFSDIDRLTNAHLPSSYNFLSSIIRQQLPPSTFELTRQQYGMLSFRGAEFDLIEYINMSDKKKLTTGYPTTIFHYVTQTWRAPAFHANGCRIFLDYSSVSPAVNYDKYYWGYTWMVNSTMGLNNSDLDIGNLDPEALLPTPAVTEIENTITPYIETPDGVNAEIRMLDVKLNVSGAKYGYFDTASAEWVYYYNDTNHYFEQGYMPFYGAVNYYQVDMDDTNIDSSLLPQTQLIDPSKWKELHPYDPNLNVGGGEIPYNGNILFFPETIRDGALEPAKILTQWPQYYSEESDTPDPLNDLRYPESGQMTFNPGIHLGETTDQSRVVYNVCRQMLQFVANYIDGTVQYSIGKVVDADPPEFLGRNLYSGIDVETERNRRYSAITMTEPYFVTTPIGNGEIVSYAFVDINNNFIINDGGVSLPFSPTNPNMFLKIKASKAMIDSIERQLQIVDLNTDIIETLTIEDPVSKASQLHNDPLYYYLNFSDPSDPTVFFNRQEDCTDDLVASTDTGLGVVGQGHHKVFTIHANPSFTPNSILYSLDNTDTPLMKVSGLGFYSKMDRTGTVKNYLNVYCSNYDPVNAPVPGPDISATVTNQYVPFIDDANASIINRSNPNEKFKPMVKISGMNGYVKIMERNPFFKPTRAADGKYEIVYNVEFPYCPGSNFERTNYNAIEGTFYRDTHVLKKVSYIPCGSWACGADGKYDVGNDRYAPYADDSFTYHSVFVQADSNANKDNPIVTQPFYNGGGILNVSASQKNTIKYPPYMVWKYYTYDVLSEVKPRLTLGQTTKFRRYGTYQMTLSETSEDLVYSRDVKLFGLVDNRQWKFSSNSFLSYINRENPSYICAIDTSALFKDLTKYQKANAALPDLKRWLYGYFSGFANTLVSADKTTADDVDLQRGVTEFRGSFSTPPTDPHLGQAYYDTTKLSYYIFNGDIWKSTDISQIFAAENIVTENVYTLSNAELSNQGSRSDIIIESWDQTQLGGNGNWRPLSPISTDDNKAPGPTLMSNLYVKSGSVNPVFDDAHVDNMFSVQLGYLDTDSLGHFPVGYAPSDDGNPLSGMYNLALFDTVSLNTYHVAHLRTNDGGYYRAYIKDPSGGHIATLDEANIDLGVPGQFILCQPKIQMNKSDSFELFTSQIVQGLAESMITRYIDIRSTYADVTDFERYINNLNKIFFRIRVVKGKSYSVSYTNEDTSEIQYLWNTDQEGTDTSTDVNSWVNYPWNPSSDGTHFDTAFDWEKVFVKEIVRKLAMSYFKCSSK